MPFRVASRTKNADGDAVPCSINQAVFDGLPPQVSGGHLDFSVSVMKTMITVLGEEQGTIEVNPFGVAG
jgi:hypothetical protein